MRTMLAGVLGRMPRPTPAMAVALLALLIAASGAAVAAIPGGDGTITACGNNKTGALRVIDTAQMCSSKETLLTWKNGLPGSTVDNAATAANADKLDNKDSTDFYAAGSKVADSSHADTADSATNAEDANSLDGKDSTEFLASDGFYEVKQIFNQASTANGFAVGRVTCDDGDLVVGGGYHLLDETSKVATDTPFLDRGESGTQSGWVIAWTTPDPSTTDEILVVALCADFGDPHAVPEA